MLVHRLVEDGNGAERRRRAEREGGLRLVLRRLADETYPTTKGTVQPMPMPDPPTPRLAHHRDALTASPSEASA
jgi:Flp pilus assembly protein CpaB